MPQYKSPPLLRSRTETPTLIRYSTSPWGPLFLLIAAVAMAFLGFGIAGIMIVSALASDGPVGFMFWVVLTPLVLLPLLCARAWLSSANGRRELVMDRTQRSVTMILNPVFGKRIETRIRSGDLASVLCERSARTALFEVRLELQNGQSVLVDYSHVQDRMTRLANDLAETLRAPCKTGERA